MRKSPEEDVSLSAQSQCRQDIVPRLCILTSVHSAFDIRIFHKEARSLAESGYDVTLITREDKSQVVDGVRLIALPQPRDRLRRVWGTCRMFRVALRQRADVYHFHDPELIPAGLLLKLVTGKAVVYDVHEDYPKFIAIKYWLPKSLRGVIAAIFRIFEQFSCRFFDAVVAATDDIAANFCRHPMVVTVKNYPLQTKVPPLHKRPISTNRQITLIHIGTLSTVTGIPQVVEALAYVDGDFDVRLRLAGKFAEDGCRELIAASSQAGRVEYLGWLDQGELLEQLSNSDIGVACLLPIPQFVTSEPNKLFEYMRCGLPVVASDFPLWREIIESAHCGVVVNPQDPQAIASAIEYLLTHEAEAEAMGLRGREAAQKFYNWESEAIKLLQLYDYLLETGVK
jgi:glycosyltransferase involved in cell wall biosynthesis